MKYLATAVLCAGGVWFGMNHPVAALIGLLIFIFGALVLSAVAEARK